MNELKKNIFPVLCLGGFIIIAYLVTKNAVTTFDFVIQDAVFSNRSDTLTAFFTAITHSGDWPFVTLFCLLLVFFRRTRYVYGIPLSCAAIGGTLLYQVLKYIFQRPRPDVSLHLITEGGFSFPSGHSMTIMLVYGLLILLLRSHFLHTQYRPAAQIAAVILGAYIFLVGFSRIYVGVHYPTDVLGGWLLALFILWMSKSFVEQLPKDL